MLLDDTRRKFKCKPDGFLDSIPTDIHCRPVSSSGSKATDLGAYGATIKQWGAGSSPVGRANHFTTLFMSESGERIRFQMRTIKN